MALVKHKAGETPRGIRNNNPGNIRFDGDKWQGLAASQTDGDFCQFVTPVMGLRALMLILLKYNLKYGLTCVRSIINRWAPPAENDTGSYQRVVAGRLGVAVDTTLSLREPLLLARLAGAIAIQENGAPPPEFPTYWYDETTYADAAQKALQSYGLLTTT